MSYVVSVAGKNQVIFILSHYSPTFYGFPDLSGRSKGSIVIIFETGINQHKVLRILSNHKNEETY